MRILFRKLKATLGIGTIWGGAFAGVGAALGALLPTTSFLSTALGLGTVAGVGGLLLGVGFAGLFSVMEGRRTLDELTARRATLWGFLAGSTLALAGSVVLGTVLDVVGAAEAVLGLSIPVTLQFAAVLVGAVSYGAVAAALASVTVSLAKRAPGPVLPAASAPSTALPPQDRADAIPASPQ